MRASAVLTGLMLLAPPVVGQEPSAPPASMLTGTVFDSLGVAPLAGADVFLEGGVASGRTDSAGRFVLRAPPGVYRVGFAHPGLSNWALLHPVREVRLGRGGNEIELATPSPETVLARTCGSGALVGGAVQDLLTLMPLGGAVVDVRGQGRDPVTVRASGDGGWFACLPDPSLPLEVRATLGTHRSRAVTVAAGPSVRLQDLFVPAARPAQVQGTVVDGPTGDPLGDVSVELVGTRLRTVTRPDGSFRFTGVPPGEVTVAVERLGYGRRVLLVHAEGETTARVTLQMYPAAIATDSVVVTVEGGRADPGRMTTRFDGLDREQIEALLPRSLGVGDLIRNANIPGLKVREVDYQSASGLRQRGLCVETSRRSTMASGQCEMVEVYVNDVRVAEAEFVLDALDPGSIDRFQIISATQAGIQYLGTPRSRNGILLLWTRGR